MPNVTITVGTEKRFALPKHQFMQLMEPLGSTDGSVDASWNFETDDWMEAFIAASKDLGPTMIRWPGGCLSSYYHWREGIGPFEKRPLMHNILWGGMETNRVGTHEYIDYCRRIGADPLIGINFESDGRENWATFRGLDRRGTLDETLQWIDYCNNPGNSERKANGAEAPFDVRFWQIGNETSYDPNGFDVETASARTKVFAQAIKGADRDLKLLGWGCSGWAPRMLEVAGEHLDYIAFHHHFSSGIDNNPLSWTDYLKDPEVTWTHLLHGYKSTEKRIAEMREQVSGHDVKLAMTESHFGTGGRNRSEVLATWAAGVAYARVLNVHERNGDLLEIATLADFVGTRWSTSAIIVEYPYRISYLMPVARIMSMFRKGRGTHELDANSSSEALDVTASVDGSKIYLHVVNTRFADPVTATFDLGGKSAKSGVARTLALDPMFHFNRMNVDEAKPTESKITDPRAPWTFPAASVTVVELEV